MKYTNLALMALKTPISLIASIAYFALVRMFYASLYYADTAFLKSSRVGTLWKTLFMSIAGLSLLGLVCSKFMEKCDYSGVIVFLLPWFISWIDRLLAWFLHAPGIEKIWNKALLCIFFLILPALILLIYAIHGFPSWVNTASVFMVVLPIVCVFLKYCLDWTAAYYCSQWSKMELSHNLGHTPVLSVFKTYALVTSIGFLLVTLFVYEICIQDARDCVKITARIIGLVYLGWLNAHLNQFIPYCLTGNARGNTWIARWSNSLSIPTLIFVLMGSVVLFFELNASIAPNAALTILFVLFWIIIGVLNFYLERLVHYFLSTTRITQIGTMLSIGAVLAGTIFFTTLLARLEHIGGILIMVIVLHQCAGTSRGIKVLSH